MRRTQCCIAGGGPAGVMLGVLLARAGIDVVVLEKHADFLRDFRGDTVHPSTMQVMDELGWLDEFLARPHQELPRIVGQIGDERVTMADFSHLPTRAKFIALMPQWDFLDFLAGHGRRYPTFAIEMRTEVIDLLNDEGRVAGVIARTERGDRIEIRADVTIGADGRSSTVRRQAGLDVESIATPIDVLWMRLPKHADDPHTMFGNVRNGRVFVTIDRGDYWQCALVIPKGGYDDVRRAGLDAFRAIIVDIVPAFRDRVGELRSWDDIKLLTVLIDRLREWSRRGLLCIGDAAHAMSPVGGVGINLAIQDAVAAANLLFEPLRRGVPPSPDALRSVQHRREFPTRATQFIQRTVQNYLFVPAMSSRAPIAVPLPIRWLRDHPFLQRIPARMVGLGFRPEHVRTPDLFAGRR